MFSSQQLPVDHGPARDDVWWQSLFTLLLLLACFQVAQGADLSAARKAFAAGQYRQVASDAQAALAEKEDVEDWGVLLTSALMAQGRYAEALTAVTNALATESRSVRLRWAAREACLYNDQADTAARLTGEIQRFFSSRSWLYREPRDLLLLGRIALLSGTDPKIVLERVYSQIKKANPALEEAHVASGELALEKHDYALAAKLFQEGLKTIPESADLHYGLARAFAPNEPKAMLAELEAALNINSNHVPSLMLLADHELDAEDYAAAGRFLDTAKAVNPWEPDAWAYAAVIDHLNNKLEDETKARETALKYWSSNPRVDYLIGLKLSQKYRFAAGASHQKRALGMDGDYLPAKMQLAQDLLRLGEEQEGWRIAREVQRLDAYDVAANNLSALHDVIAKFETLTNAQFHLRMPAHDASVYGARALELLEKARLQLCAKYQVELPETVLVEMFNDEKDFAVRTFGMPENDGFLGVCFGRVITANGPAARRGRHFNWESMLWHEFCHVVTLQLTANKMPRWLSEGISVYEERLANPSWGEHLNPRYREMLLGPELTPVSQLSGAFLAPKTGEHLQFAYYQASLVVQFLVERFGQEKLGKILHDLADSVPINEALARNTVPMAELEPQFESFAKQVAAKMGPGLDWQRPKTAGSRRPPLPSALEDPFSDSIQEESPAATTPASASTNYWLAHGQIDTLLQKKKWAEAEPLLERLLRLYPEDTGPECAARKLAAVHRSLGDTNRELALLKDLAQRDDEALDVYTRLMSLAGNAADWATVLTNGNRYLAIDPLVAAPYRFIAPAAEALGLPDTAISAYKCLLLLEPPNPAEVHYRLAKLLYEKHDPSARLHLLQALEEAPRFRDALKLFKQMNEERRTDANPQAEDRTSNSETETFSLKTGQG